MYEMFLPSLITSTLQQYACAWSKQIL